MIRKFPVSFKTIYFLLLAGYLLFPAGVGDSCAAGSGLSHSPENSSATGNPVVIPESLKDLNADLISCLLKEDMVKGKIVAEKLMKKIKTSGDSSGVQLSSSHYLLGVYLLKLRKYGEATRYLETAVRLKERRNENDERYSKALYNLSVAYYGLGDYANQYRSAEKALETEIKIYGPENSESILTYFSLVSASIGLQDYNKALEDSKIALKIYENNTDPQNEIFLSGFYTNLGVLYMRLSDFSKALIYLEKSESFYNLNKLPVDENYYGILTDMAVTLGNLGQTVKSTAYYEKGIKLAMQNNSETAFITINNYAISLAIKGKISKGESLLRQALSKAKSNYGVDSPLYYAVLYYYAEYLREFKIDNSKALSYFKICLDYLSNHKNNRFLVDQFYLSYASGLADSGDNYKALELIREILGDEKISRGSDSGQSGQYTRSAADSIKADRNSLKILKLKYQILWNIYSQKRDLSVLEAASSTAKLIVEVLEKVRINISEEDSRLILGDKYRTSYLNAIRDLNLLYERTGNETYLSNAFEYMEKSKVAGLLAATRELNASQFSIPADLSELEKRLRTDISFLTERVDVEMKSQHPDTMMIAAWKDNILKSSIKKDSLVSVFEKQYPGYYSFKYNTSVAGLSEIPGLIGRDVNYINFVASDTVLYVFVANRKYHHLLAIQADSAFYTDLRQFRHLLSMPSPSGNAREAFIDFQATGYRIYHKIIEPLRPYFISDNLLVSPDNLLSYIPLETLPTAPECGDKLLYNRVKYLMNDFDISYTYSVTFMAESMKRSTRFTNRLVAFAPSYAQPINLGSVLIDRQTVNGMLPDLPFAKQEAEYVSDVTGGKLYENNDAREAVYKNESGKYDIIHLAMHTVLNDRDPMYSTLIFSGGRDSLDDRYLKTYEVYSIPLRAKMVVLSSCNSGSGFLYSGEGILSLARGFMYSGSKSVVMAMWEIEDRSGTDIVKKFYDNLKRGYSKSSALRKARMSYLMEADQLRAHPYFWSALVVYGNNQPLYYSKWVSFFIPVILILGVILATYLFSRRRYS